MWFDRRHDSIRFDSNRFDSIRFDSIRFITWSIAEPKRGLTVGSVETSRMCGSFGDVISKTTVGASGMPTTIDVMLLLSTDVHLNARKLTPCERARDRLVSVRAR